MFLPFDATLDMLKSMTACSLHLHHHLLNNSVLCCNREESHLVINMMNMQSQSGGSDFVCFAIASATALCDGQNPSSLKWIHCMICNIS